ncbi:MAG: tetratricopeptide repeat protein [Bradymonadales bacterium]|nr:tetratricopeptide repeat protein [Bradymonadales bacterium]
MDQYLTYAALKTKDIEFVLHQCTEAAKTLGLKFQVPKVPTDAAHVWVGVFDNGWVFSLADPAVWELLDIFSKVSKGYALPYLSGSTEGDYKKWSYEYMEGGKVLHQFYADPSTRFDKREYSKVQGDPYAMEKIFGVSLFQLRKLLRQFETGPVQEFLKALKFEIQYARLLRFVVIEQDTEVHTPRDLSTILTPNQIEAMVGKTGMFKGLETEETIDAIRQADNKGFSGAASIKATRFVAEQDFNESYELFIRLRRERLFDIAFTVADKLVMRAKNGEFDRLPDIQRDLRIATIHGLRGMALADLGRNDEAVVELKDHALAFNRYIGPQNRASVASVLGKILVQQQRYQDALDPLRLRLAERPLDATAWCNLATAAYHTDRPQEGHWAARWGIATDPSLAEWSQLRTRLALRERDLLPPRNPDLARTRRAEARNLIKAGQKIQAIEKYREALNHNPMDSDSVWALASILAEALREELVSLESVDFELARACEQVAFTTPAWPWSWGTLVEICLRRRDTVRAAQACDAFARVHMTKISDGLDLGVWITHVEAELGTCMLQTVADRFVELRTRGMATMGERDTQRHRCDAMLGWALLRANRPHEALTPLIEATGSDPNDAENWANVAEAHYRMRNSLAAGKAVARGLKVNPEHPRLNEMQRYLRQQGQG